MICQILFYFVIVKDEIYETYHAILLVFHEY